VTALGSNVHIFARPQRRQELAWCFDTVLGCGPVITLEHPGMEQPMLLVRFPGGGNLSIEFTEDAPDDDQPRLGAWLELRADDPAAVLRTAVDAGLTRVEHPGHPYYFMARAARYSRSRQQAERRQQSQSRPGMHSAIAAAKRRTVASGHARAMQDVNGGPQFRHYAAAW